MMYSLYGMPPSAKTCSSEAEKMTSMDPCRIVVDSTAASLLPWPSSAVDVVPHIKPRRVSLWHLTFGEIRADVVVRRDVEEFRLRAPSLGRPVLPPPITGRKLGALFRTRSLGLVDRGTTGLRVNRREHVVIGKWKRVQELEAIAIQDPKVAVPTRVRGRLRELPVDLCVRIQERRQTLNPSQNGIMRRVLGDSS